MNGGLMHAIDCCRPAEIERAAAGFRHFGMEAAAQAIEWAAGQAKVSHLDTETEERLEAEANDRYWRAVGDDGSIRDRYQIVYRDQPDTFAPLD
jgi:hypothetical protein